LKDKRRIDKNHDITFSDVKPKSKQRCMGHEIFNINEPTLEALKSILVQMPIVVGHNH